MINPGVKCNSRPLNAPIWRPRETVKSRGEVAAGVSVRKQSELAAPARFFSACKPCGASLNPVKL